MDMSGGSNSTAMPNMDMGEMGSMAMYFNFMLPFSVVFKEWFIRDQATLIGSCFGVVVLAVVYEIIKNFRLWWERKIFSDLTELMQMQTENSNLKVEGDTRSLRTLPQFWIYHSFQSILHMVQVFLAYFLMLIVMTYNVWLVLSTVIGAGFGYFLTGGVLTFPVPTSSEKVFLPKSSASMSNETSFSGSGRSKPPSYINNFAEDNDIP